MHCGVTSMNGIDVIVFLYSDDGKGTNEVTLYWDFKGLCAFVEGPHTHTHTHTDADHVRL